MRSARLIAALAVPVLVLAACSSAKQAVVTPSTTAASSVAVASSSAAPSPTSTSTTPKPTPALKPAPKPTPKPKVKPKPAPVDPLTGGKLSTNPVLAVKIDNTYFAVPQFGVSDADVVFVEQVEGGLTRIIGVFHSTLPTEVGPVRSVRSTDAQLLPAFGKPGLVFSGGAGGPLADLAATSVVDTSAMGDAYFRSDVATGTYNLHADLAKIAVEVKNLGPVRSIGFTFVPHSPEVLAGPKVSSIHVVMQSGTTDFAWMSGHWVRMRDGAPVSDYQGKVEGADNVLVQHVEDEPDGTVDSVGSPSYLSKTVGSGKVSLFRDGHQVNGTWKRAKASDPFTYLDNNGKPLPFKPGKTWIMLAPQTAQVSTD